MNVIVLPNQAEKTDINGGHFLFESFKCLGLVNIGYDVLHPGHVLRLSCNLCTFFSFFFAPPVSYVWLTCLTFSKIVTDIPWVLYYNIMWDDCVFYMATSL